MTPAVRRRLQDMDLDAPARSTTTVTVPVGGGGELCVESFGRATYETLLLIGGATWSMDWWEDGLCHALADRGRRVVRYDQRDTGRSTSWPAGAPGYSGADLTRDAVAVLDALGVSRAHVVGLSMGGGTAQALALQHRDRLATLTLMSTSPIDPAIRDLPPPTEQVRAAFADDSPAPDWTDRDAVVDHVVEGERPYAGPGCFDEQRLRALVARVHDRSNDMAASLTNHFLIDDDELADRQLGRLAGLPTLVLHGTDDPLFPLAHGRALAAAIPEARLVELPGVGHQLPPPALWPRLVDLLVDHTAAR